MPRLSVYGAFLLPLAVFSGCSTLPPSPPVVNRAAPTETTPAPVPEAETTPAPSPAPPLATEPAQKPLGTPGITDVVDPGGDTGTKSLVQTAKAERARRAVAGDSVVVITDKTLPNLPKGQLTYAAPAKKKAVEPGDAGGADAAHDEAYWRSRALDIRTRWKKSAEEVKDLEQSAAGWRRRFYAENDPYARDSHIKPEWDRVLDRLGKARAEVDAAKKELEDFQEEGRRAGALPGWLREGTDQEPVAEKKSKQPGTLESKEPSVYQQPAEQKPPGDHGAVR
ncbi:MAG TPA: hypothetical protein VH988_29690 [Thermoanaerobaculia bacterium]|jgi:hypothetical protein|nr:hypothetical protein [Thermoanaerobaculia bacterium]